MNYKEFVADAVKNYDALPQETNELYRNHYVRIPFELRNHLDHGGGGKGSGALGKERPYAMGLRFDAVMGSGKHILNDSGLVMIKDNSKLSSRFLEDAMHGSAEDKYAAFINTYSKSTLFVDVPEGMHAKVNLRFIATGAPLNTRVVISLGKDARLNLLELYESAPSNAVIGVMHEARLQDSAFAEINSLHNENANTVVLCFFKDRLGAGSSLRFNSVYNGGSHVRVRNSVEAGERNSSAEVNELVFGSAAQKFDINTRIVNAAPDTGTSLQSRAALMDTSLCMLKGFAQVVKGAKRSNSYIHERGILLDRGARIDSLPDMSVDENNVKATHSSATAPIGTEEVFYLMSKGMDDKRVRKLIVNGFFAGSIEKIENAAMREMTMSLINEKLETNDFGRGHRSRCQGPVLETRG
jgi:Fe-S cluster assembly scaffold protein SufB